MLINANTAISTDRILLVPYCITHVATYHEWMKDPDLQEATASELLSLPEEYSMQRSWRNDPDKLTFIACLPIPPDSETKFRNTSTTPLSPGQYDSPTHMLGDINLFISSLSEADEQDGSSAVRRIETEPIVGEIELMLAVKALQGKGYGRSTLLAFLQYIADHEATIIEEYMLGFASGFDGTRGRRFEYLRVRIHESNGRSLGLFESVGFRRVGDGKANYFGEVEMRVGGGEGGGREDGLKDVLGDVLRGYDGTALAGYWEGRYGVEGEVD